MNSEHQKKATIKDIAREANVAISTVSYVLNHIKPVKPETNKRIMEAIEKLNYQPRQVARSLKTRQSMTIGVIVPEISNFFFTEIIRGLEDIAYKNNYSIILCNTNEDVEKEKKYLAALMGKDIDGLVFISTGQNEHILDNYKDVPIVVVDRKLGESVSMILVDNIQGGYLATKFLLDKKGYPIYYLSGSLSISTYFDRMTGYLNALKEEKLEPNDSFIHQCELNIKSGYATMKQIIKSGQVIKSVFAANDILALGAMKAMIESGLTVGEEVLLIGYDDIETASMVTPALTTISQPKYEMGVSASKLLLEQISDKTTLTKKIIFTPELIVRDTAK